MENAGDWKVFSQVFGGTRKFIVGRIIDTTEEQHAGNMEYAPDMGDIKDEQLAKGIAQDLNVLEKALKVD